MTHLAWTKASPLGTVSWKVSADWNVEKVKKKSVVTSLHKSSVISL